MGSRLTAALREHSPDVNIVGIDNLLRPGAETNRGKLVEDGVRFFHGDLRFRSDLEQLPPCDWVIDAAAQPSVLAGVDGRSSARQVSEHNLGGTLNLLEYCRETKAGLLLLSSSRVYSISALAALPMGTQDEAFVLDSAQALPCAVSREGITEAFSTTAPISLYGATKLASEIMALEYGATFGFPVWINRCGVLAGAGQFGTAEQGIFSYWLHAYAARLPLRYIGFGGHGYQVRDAFHPEDLAQLLLLQMQRRDPPSDAIFNVGGGAANAMSLAQLTRWCAERFGPHTPQSDERSRPFDIPWVVMDSSRVQRELGWQPKRTLSSILEEIAEHVNRHPNWLRQAAAR